MSSSEAKNLEVIVKEIKRHNATCNFPALAVLMNPFEVERLDWDEVLGVPIKPDPSIGTGRARILCDGIHGGVTEEEEVGEVLPEKIEVGTPVKEPVLV